jgi:hypothetical protein
MGGMMLQIQPPGKTIQPHNLVELIQGCLVASQGAGYEGLRQHLDYVLRSWLGRAENDACVEASQGAEFISGLAGGYG